MSMDDAMALFHRFDVNGNGTLGFDELREPLRRNRKPLMQNICSKSNDCASQVVADCWGASLRHSRPVWHH